MEGTMKVAVMNGIGKMGYTESAEATCTIMRRAGLEIMW